MKNKGFTLVELLAVITILAIIMVIATTNVLKSINDSKEKTRYMAAKEIVEIAEAYFAENNSVSNVTIGNLKYKDGNNNDVSYLEEDVTNPETGENNLDLDTSDHIICRNNSYSSSNQIGYSDNNKAGYEFDGYWYGFSGCK